MLALLLVAPGMVQCLREHSRVLVMALVTKMTKGGCGWSETGSALLTLWWLTW
jgi:hypothetical protein